MTRGGENATSERGSGERRVVYCLIPADLADRLHEPLYRHFAGDPGVEVVVERRRRERRAGKERRRVDGESPEGAERRQLRSTTGRRIGERRAALVPVGALELPRRARRHAERLSFVERREPSGEQAEDRDTARLVARIQAGDSEAFGILYARYFDRVYAYLRSVLANKHDAEDVAQQVFTKLFEAIPRYERRRQPFRAWMFAAVRNAALDHLERERRTEPVEPAELDSRREAAQEAAEQPDLSILDWITDRDLLLFVERLPLPQRQVIVLRYLFGMKPGEIAHVLGRTRTSVSTLHYRAMEFLEERLTAAGRAPTGKRGLNRMKAWGTPANVIRSRRFALWD